MTEPIIRLRDVWKSYGETDVLKGLNLEVQRGETVVILGRSGGGKSTTLRQIMGLETPDAGEVFVEGHEISSMSQKERFITLRHVGMLFQQSALFDSLTVGENCGFFLTEHPDIHTGEWASKQEIAERVAHALEVVGLEGTEALMPSDLSGGMRRRAALARLIVYKPTIVLLDEPTAGLDPVLAMQISRLICDVGRELNGTMILVTHDLPATLEVADRIAYHNDGKIVRIAPKEEFFDCDEPLIRSFVENAKVPEDLVKGGECA